jgi:hypothetical protein
VRADKDLVLRLMRAGVKRKMGRFATGVVRLFNIPDSRSRMAASEARNRYVFDDTLAEDRFVARRGMSQSISW